jgi:hypothetical protein
MPLGSHEVALKNGCLTNSESIKLNGVYSLTTNNERSWFAFLRELVKTLERRPVHRLPADDPKSMRIG